MTKGRAEQLIVISLFVLLASTVGATLVNGGTSKEKLHYGKKITGGFLTMFFASLVAEAAPEIGALLAISVASYAFFHDGLPVINSRYAEMKKQEAKEKGKPPATGTVPSAPETLLQASPTILGGTLV